MIEKKSSYNNVTMLAAVSISTPLVSKLRKFQILHVALLHVALTSLMTAGLTPPSLQNVEASFFRDTIGKKICVTFCWWVCSNINLILT
jgi:hypothetical protein